ncbi:MAG: hypothetical protein AAGA46_07945 [Cyanobacteria bacterium P01_F01_bin.13]
MVELLYSFSPPFYFMAAGFLFAIASGSVFAIVLKRIVNGWRENNSSEVLAKLGKINTRLSFIGMCAGTSVFLASGLGCFRTPALVSYGVSLPMTFLMGAFVWRQLRGNLALLESGQARAFEIDFFS